jgi:CDP-diacylglycerol--glycerol-3-phosphate 3-phosphatidyltransferase
MTVPTQLTVLRILLTFVLMGLLFVPGLAARIAVLIGFLLAGLTDWLDGYLARRRKQVTTLGQILDPLADKLLISATLVSLVQLDLVQSWMVAVIIGREIAVTGLRNLAYSRGLPMPASGRDDVPSLHCFGLAVDINYAGNPFVGLQRAGTIYKKGSGGS